MVFPIAGGTQDTSYEISNSLRFNDDDDAVLDRGSISGTLSKAHTFSLWVKRSTLDDARHVLAGMGDGSGNISWIEFNANSIRYFGDGAGNYAPQTTAKYRDVSAWYHIVVKVDTTQSSASNRLKIYVNGTEQAYSGTPPPQNHQADMDECTIGFNPGDEFDGYMAEFHFLDGVAYDPTYFGQTDINGVWIPKEYTGGNYGTFGFYLQFKETGTSANSSGMGADTSGNDNHFSATNLAAIDVTTDTPTNNFATMNSIAITNSNQNLSEGSTVHTVSSGAWIGAYSTLGFASGKWYAELKVIADDNTSWGVIQSGGDSVANINNTNSGYIGKYADGWGWWGNASARIINNNSDTDYGSQESVNDIFMIAVDVDGGKLWIGKNGTFFNAPGTSNAGDPASGTNPGFSGITFTDFVHFASGLEAAENGASTVGWNFGNAAYSISSGNSDANGYGNFEYAVPSGFYSLCTKNLAEFG